MPSVSDVQQLFAPAPGYFNTASNGIPPVAAVDALREGLDDWQRGRSTRVLDHFWESVDRGRAAFGRLVGVDTDLLALGGSVSALVGLVAAALPAGSEVLVAEGDFTSAQYPFAVRPGLRVRAVPLAALAAEVRPDTALVSVSAVQSADGAVADLAAISAACRVAGALTLIDGTQAIGWCPVDASAFDFVVCGAYKWLLSPNGVALMTVAPARLEMLTPHSAGWYAAEDVWNSIYSLPMQLAKTARRLDTTPAWHSWPATVIAFELIESVGVEAIGEHNVRLANRLRAAAGVGPGESAIASLVLGDDVQRRLDAAGLTTAVRAGRVRFSCHLYTTDADIDRAIECLDSVELRNLGL